jgi:N-carbamoylputrescine amidase
MRPFYFHYGSLIPWSRLLSINCLFLFPVLEKAVSMNKYTIALIQLNLNNTQENNLKKCTDWIHKAKGKGASLVCLPELYGSFYFCQEENTQHFRFAEPLHGKSFTAFSRLAKELGIAIIVPFFEKRMAGVYHNSACLIDADGKEAGLYRKMHIPDDPGYYEKYYFTPGDLGFKSFPAGTGNIGILICWDQWFPEAARITALKGAEVLFYPTAIGWHPAEKQQYGEKQHSAWINVMRGHAVANNIYVAAVNRTGLEKPLEGADGIEFWGSSFIAGPQGEIIAQASNDREEIIIAEVDPEYIEKVRQHWPFLRDRRTDAYSDIIKRAGI